MTTMNRFCKFYSERSLYAHLAECKLGLGFLYSSKDKHKRENCVLDAGLQ